MDEDGRQEQLDLEIELIESSLLPDESLSRASTGLAIKSTASTLVLNISTSKYPQDVGIEVKGSEVGREEAEGWRVWVEERMKGWNTDDEYVRLDHSRNDETVAGLMVVTRSFRS